MYLMLSSTLTFFTLLTLYPFNEALLQRCYSCRSRGELGTCKDSFDTNKEQLGVETNLCASGWCTKMIETEDAFKEEYGTATERRCLQRGPSDNEERCAYTLVQHKKVYMCFCKGDLCNNANNLLIDTKLFIVVAIVLVLKTVCST